MTLADLFTAMANAIRAKGGTSAALYPNQMPQAIADIQPQISLQSKTKSYTPSETAQSETVAADTGYDGLQQVSVSVGAVSSSYVGTGITRRTSSDLGASGATVTAPAGYYENAATKTISSGSATPAASISATGAGKVVGNGTIKLSKSAVSNTPQVTPGYISAGTAGNTSVELTASVTTKSSETFHPSASDQTIAGDTYLTGTQTFKGVLLTNLDAANIKKDVVVKIGDSTDDDCVTSVTGTYEGGGGGASNIKQGTFTTGSTGGSTDTFDTGYSGSGYPIALFIYVDGGPYNNGTGGNTAWYNSVTRYDCGFYSMVKSRTTTTPTYGTSGADNYGTVTIIYKNSTSTATTYTRTSSMTANSYSSSNAGASTACARFKGNNHTVSYYVGNAGSSTIGFAKSTKFAYIAIYSS